MTLATPAHELTSITALWPRSPGHRSESSKSFYGSIAAVQEQFCGTPFGCDRRHVFDRLVYNGVNVDLEPAVTAGPTTIFLFYNPEEQRHPINPGPKQASEPEAKVPR